jgi:hypothetical protein
VIDKHKGDPQVPLVCGLASAEEGSLVGDPCVEVLACLAHKAVGAQP